LPSIQKLQEELGDRDDIAIYALNSGSDDRAEVGEFWADSGFGFTALLDKPDDRGEAARALGALAFPTNIVLGADGKVRYASVGFDEQAIRAAMGL